MADTEKPVLPPTLYPTKTRLQLARDIKAGHVRHYYQFAVPWSCRTYDDRNVSARVREFVFASPKLATYREPDGHNYTIVDLTPAGEEWLNTYGSTE